MKNLGVKSYDDLIYSTRKNYNRQTITAQEAKAQGVDSFMNKMLFYEVYGLRPFDRPEPTEENRDLSALYLKVDRFINKAAAAHVFSDENSSFVSQLLCGLMKSYLSQEQKRKILNKIVTARQNDLLSEQRFLELSKISFLYKNADELASQLELFGINLTDNA